jgi:RNA polymerase sigma-70 factor (ECF subfamily)
MERVPPSEDTDAELLGRCRLGDEEAFDVLVLRHQQRAFNVAFQLLRDHEDAREVAQDAFVGIYRNLDRFRGECEFTTWLHQIVVNLARNKYRWWKRRGRQQAVSLDDPQAAQVAGTTALPDAQAIKAEFVQRLTEKMAELPEEFREVLVLRNVEDMSYQQIAVALQCPVGTIKSRIARARDALREQMNHD